MSGLTDDEIARVSGTRREIPPSDRPLTTAEAQSLSADELRSWSERRAEWLLRNGSAALMPGLSTFASVMVTPFRAPQYVAPDVGNAIARALADAEPAPEPVDPDPLVRFRGLDLEKPK